MQDSSRILTTQVLTVSATTAGSAVFSSQTYQLRLSADTPVNYRVADVGATQTATTADPFLPVNWVEYVTVSPGQKINAIRASSDGTVTAANGTFWVAEMT